MSASFYDLLKYAKTGIASPDMTGFDKLKALAMAGGGKEKTLTGIPPLSFKSDGTPLISWSISGNMTQTGTPTPDNPVMPTFCGVRTGNLFDYAEYARTYIANAGLWEYTGTTGTVFRIPCTENTVYTLSLNKTFSLSVYRIATANTNSVPTLNNPIAVTDIARRTSATNSYSFATPAGAKYILFQVNASAASEVAAATMLNLGSTALPYEPFGWAEKITCAGQTVPVYLGQTQTVRRVRKYEFTGLEQWSINDATRVLYTFAISNFFATNGITCMCSHYPAQNNAAGAAEVQNKHVCFRSSTYNQFYLKDTNFDSTDALKSYLAAQYAAGAPVTVWYVLATEQTAIVNEPLCKIGDYADELSSTDAAVTIPTAKGANTLTVETELQPSEMTITFKG